MSETGLDVVVVGCSWGGLAAAGCLLAVLPPDFAVPIVVVQHRCDAESALSELLGRQTACPVTEPDDKEELLAGRVYVAPAGYHLLLDSRRFSLATEAPVRYSRPSIDVLFESVAGAFGGRAAGVVLTGANDDGAAGLAKVAAAGGLALVQDPDTAERPAMPAAALAAVPTAIVGDIGAIARRLVEVAGRRGDLR